MAQLNLPSTSSCSSTSASTSYAHNNYYVYDVFINHRGPDCKKTLATYLYKRLCDKCLRVFLDQQELQEGDDLTSQITGAIKNACVHIAIFSKNYAKSNWCLNELLLMVESKATILPVFYDGVNPTDLRRAQREDKGVYAQALRELEDKKTHQDEPRYPSDTINKWRHALSVAADISGFDISGFELKNYNEQHEIIEKIVEGVLKNVKKPINVAKYPIGLDKKVKDFEIAVSLQAESRQTRVIGIVGLGGVGKTTLTNEIFNRLLSKYDRSCHLYDVRGKSLESSQSELLRGLARCSETITNIHYGIQKIKDLPDPLSLIILDNVDAMEQLDALLVPMKDSIRQGSLILITSRNKDVLKNAGIEESFIYELKGLNPQHSEELFCSHAFGETKPATGFELVVKNFLDRCHGLPLALKVIGASLHGKTLQKWDAELCKISKTLNPHIKDQLKISYDGLDEEDKKIFLDIACFFIGEDSDTVVRIWAGSGWNGWSSLWKLQSRYLIELDSENRIRMHDLLRDLGRDIAEKEDPHRLWRPTEDLLHTLFDQFPVRGIGMVHQHGSEWPDPQSFIDFAKLPSSCLVSNMSRLQLLRAEGNFVESIFSVFESLQRGRLSPKLVWLCWDSCPFTSLPSWIPLNRLSVLEIKGNDLETLWPDEHQAPLLLRELIIDAPLSKIPKSIGKLKNLEKLVLHRNERVEEANLKTFVDELCHLKSLKCLVLKKCSNMKSLPDSFVNLTNLEHIDLSGCSNLQKLPKFFGKLRNLQLIDLSGCLSLKTFPPGRWKRRKPPRIG